jgi:hypothetical protein
MGALKYFTQLVKLNDKRYVICYLRSLDGFNINDIKEIKEYASWLVEDVNQYVIFDYYFRNGHVSNYQNRLFVSDCMNHMHDIANDNNYDYNTCRKLLNICNAWWYHNLDLMFDWDQKHWDPKHF